MSDKQRIDELERLCAEAYQVIGVLLSDCGRFEDADAQKILDNLAEARAVHLDVLPFESKPLLPKEPPLGLLVSMAIRADHALGMPGYYDQPLMRAAHGGRSHAEVLKATIDTMRQLYEEVSGHGFYSLEKESKYAALLGS